MKKANRLSATVRTSIANISASGYELSDQQLRLVNGGLAQTGTVPASITNPGETDKQTDTQHDADP